MFIYTVGDVIGITAVAILVILYGIAWVIDKIGNK